MSARGGETSADRQKTSRSTRRAPCAAGLRVFVSEIEALPGSKSLIGREAGGRGRVTVVRDCRETRSSSSLTQAWLSASIPGSRRRKSCPALVDVHDI